MQKKKEFGFMVRIIAIHGPLIGCFLAPLGCPFW